MKIKPTPLFLDGEIWRAEDERDNPDIGLAMVSYHGGGLSPFEAGEPVNPIRRVN